MPTVLKIVKATLDASEYDGLVNSWTGCGCLKEDLAPCGEMSQECEAGIKRILTQADVDSGRYDGDEPARVGDWIIEVPQQETKK